MAFLVSVRWQGFALPPLHTHTHTHPHPPHWVAESVFLEEIGLLVATSLASVHVDCSIWLDRRGRGGIDNGSTLV